MVHSLHVVDQQLYPSTVDGVSNAAHLVSVVDVLLSNGVLDAAITCTHSAGLYH